MAERNTFAHLVGDVIVSSMISAVFAMDLFEHVFPFFGIFVLGEEFINLYAIIGGILAQGYTAEDAAVIGVALHAYASQLCAKELGKRGMLPSDLEIYVAKLLNSLGY